MFPGHVARVGSSGIGHLFEPLFDLWVGGCAHCSGVGHESSVRLGQGGLSFGLFLGDLGQQVGPLSFALCCEFGGVDFISLFPHGPHDQPQLVDEVGCPRLTGAAAVLLGVTVLLELCQLGRQPAHDEVLPANGVLAFDGLSDGPGSLHRDLFLSVPPLIESLKDCLAEFWVTPFIDHPVAQGSCGQAPLHSC